MHTITGALLLSWYVGLLSNLLLGLVVLCSADTILEAGPPAQASSHIDITFKALIHVAITIKHYSSELSTDEPNTKKLYWESMLEFWRSIKWPYNINDVTVAAACKDSLQFFIFFLPPAKDINSFLPPSTCSSPLWASFSAVFASVRLRCCWGRRTLY